jgi:nucleoside diphosphate kinase
LDDIDWERTVFGLIAPDALARHLGDVVLDRIEAAGYRPVAWQVIWHRPPDLDFFHAQHIEHAWQTYMYRLVDQIFAFGPTIALLVADEQPPGAEDSYQRLRRVKGSSDPVEAGPGTIRGDLGSINIMLALMHSSDTAQDAQRESSVFFFGTGGITLGADPRELRDLISMLQLACPAEVRGYREVLAGIRARLLASAWDELPVPARKTAAALLDAGVDGLAGRGSGDRLAEALPEPHPLAAALRAEFTPDSPGPEPERLKSLLGAYGTGLDPWEALVIATSRRFPPRGTTDRL